MNPENEYTGPPVYDLFPAVRLDVPRGWGHEVILIPPTFTLHPYAGGRLSTALRTSPRARFGETVRELPGTLAVVPGDVGRIGFGLVGDDGALTWAPRRIAYSTKADRATASWYLRGVQWRQSLRGWVGPAPCERLPDAEFEHAEVHGAHVVSVRVGRQRGRLTASCFLDDEIAVCFDSTAEHGLTRAHTAEVAQQAVSQAAERLGIYELVLGKGKPITLDGATVERRGDLVVVRDQESTAFWPLADRPYGPHEVRRAHLLLQAG